MFRKLIVKITFIRFIHNYRGEHPFPFTKGFLQLASFIELTFNLYKDRFHELIRPRLYSFLGNYAAPETLACVLPLAPEITKLSPSFAQEVNLYHRRIQSLKRLKTLVFVGGLESSNYLREQIYFRFSLVPKHGSIVACQSNWCTVRVRLCLHMRSTMFEDFMLGS